MAVQYRCLNEKRSRALSDSSLLLNGIDYLEVLDALAPPGTERQRTLLVRMLKADPWGLEIENVQIEGGVRIRGIKLQWVLRATEATDDLVTQGLITQAERDFFPALPDASQFLIVRTSAAGDFSTYTLRLVQSATNPLPPNDFDPILSAVDFSFKVECPSDFDCLSDFECPPEPAVQPRIDYLTKDYASFRNLMLDRLAVIMPEWRERSASDIGIAVVEVLAYAADYLSYYQDAVGTEAYLGTARRRVSVRRHARLLDYAMHDGCNARTWLQFNVTSAGSVNLEARTQVFTRVGDQDARVSPASPAHDKLLAGRPIVFETMHAGTLFPEHNRLEFYTWGDEECCLPKGATQATLRGDLSNLSAGDVLIFVEARSPETGKAADAVPSHRHAVRLIDARTRQDPLGGQFLDPPTNNTVAVTDIEWTAEDALPFPLCVALVEVPAEDRSTTEPRQQPVSIVLGNVMLADHGQTIEGESLAEVPDSGRYRPGLQQSNVTHRVSETALETTAASRLLTQDPRRALPQLALEHEAETWIPRRDLLASDRFANEFVLEPDEQRRPVLRFGDGTFGRMPTPETMFTAAYRVGNGVSGNVGADAIAHVLSSDDGIVSVRNPLPAVGGVDPEPIEQVRQFAPQAFRTQERAVTEEDYAAVAQRHDQVQKAIATRRWTGSWYTMFLTVDRVGGQAVDADFENELRAFLERFRLAGQDLEIDGPTFVALNLAFIVCVGPTYVRGEVEQALLESFGTRELLDGQRGFFHPDNFSFGQPVYLSQVVSTAMNVPGVRWIDTDDDPIKPTRFRRWAQIDQGELKQGFIQIGRLEIARLDNDANAPENGKIEFIMEGGL